VTAVNFNWIGHRCDNFETCRLLFTW